MRKWALLLTSPAPLLLLNAGEACAQTREIGSTAPAVFAEDKEYREQPHRLGSLTMSLGAEARVEYDNNVYAEPTRTDGDARFEVSPSLRLRTAPAPLAAQFDASGTVRRYARLKSENVETWLLGGLVRWAPSKASVASGRLFMQRSVEERGDPETNIGAQFGPRRTDSFGGEAHYRRDSGHLLLDLEATGAYYNALARRDDTRDFTAYTSRATVGLRTTPTVFLTATGFVTRRAFRLDRTVSGIKRNSSTYGARLGVDIQPGGLLEGDLSAGIFRFDPDDTSAPGKTGISVSGSLTYRPRRRTAILLSASSGDVATFRNGAQQRTDTAFKLSIQQEIRHDLFATPTFGFRQTKYNASGDKQRTFIAGGEVEYVVSRQMSVAAIASYGDRDTDDPSRRSFKRFSGGVSLRMRF